MMENLVVSDELEQRVISSRHFYKEGVKICSRLGDGSDCSTASEVLRNSKLEQTEKGGNSLNFLLPNTTVPDRLLSLEQNLACRLSEYPLMPPIEYVYNPLDYAFDVHADFVHKFCQSQKEILFLGMNPGPWGMVQTGVPFGEVTIVRDWLGIDGEIGHPLRECPARPIKGFNCKRREISGWKFWNLFKDICVDPYKFFNRAFVYNYCPLAYMTATGKNVTPAEMKSAERKMINSLCDKTFCEVLDLLQVHTIIAVGKFAEKSASTALKVKGLHSIQIATIPHPSPRNFSIKNWQEETTKHLQEMDLLKFFM